MFFKITFFRMFHLDAVCLPDGDGFCEIVSYGIGPINDSIIAKYQTALLLCLTEKLKVLRLGSLPVLLF